MTTAHRGLIEQTRRNAENYQPSNITWSHVAPWEGPRLHKRAKYQAMAERALADLRHWQAGSFAPAPATVPSLTGAP
jgi:methylenetetrahydrofolate--tRNA-(uracil-5-)-methyltransferase